MLFWHAVVAFGRVEIWTAPFSSGLIEFGPVWFAPYRTAFLLEVRPDLVAIPLWIPAAAFTALALFTHGRAKPPGCCAVCGYNLTGKVSGVCPECGAIIAR